MSAFSIRSYILTDYPQVKRILEERGLFYEPMDSEERLQEKITRDPDSIFVATRENELIGTVSIMEDGRMGFIFRLCMNSDKENTGIGIALMNKAEEELFKRGFKEINILVDSKSQQLQDYYLKRGYELGHQYTWMAKERK